MANIVVDTNVWLTAGKAASAAETMAEIDCIENCENWTQEFLGGKYKPLVDSSGAVIDEYMRYIAPGGSPAPILHQLYSALWAKISSVDIDFDQAGHAILPASLSFRDPADRKFTALALTCEPPAPIYNASDTDWAKERRRLAKQRIRIRELCPEYITEKIRSD